MQDNMSDAERRASISDLITIALAALWGFAVAKAPDGQLLVANALIFLFVMIVVIERRFIDLRGQRHTMLRLITALALLVFLVRAYLAIGIDGL